MDGGYPATCTSEGFDSSVPDEIGMDTMTKYWPNVQESTSSSDYDDFWTHEWTKHGTCTGLAQETYFNTTITLAETFGTPSQYTAAVGSTVDADDLRNWFGGADKVSLQCTRLILELTSLSLYLSLSLSLSLPLSIYLHPFRSSL